jgi:2-polyprenyl-3-methyl-5-hydroxy-6-metoxy-1,4-benzoquinol methylase
VNYRIREENYYDLRPNKIRTNIILKLIGKKPLKILDIGCYDGTIGRALTSMGHQVFGVDFSTAVRQAGFKVFIGDISKGIPLTAGIFDLVFAGEIIEHLYYTEKFLKEIYRVLKKDGQLVMTTPNVTSLGRRVMLLFGKNPYLETTSDETTAGHVRYFTKDSLKTLLSHCGFRVSDFSSDVVNITDSYCLRFLARLFPNIGRTLIVKCQKDKI